MIASSKLRPSHLRKVLRARRRWARLTLEDRAGVFVRRWPLHGTAPAELGRIIHTLGVDCVIDVGAHHGGFGRICRRLGFDGDLISFEPSSASYRKLTRTIERRHDQRWTTHQLALGAQAGSLQLGIFEQTQLNSLRSPNPAAGELISDEPLSVEEVRVERLDNLWSDLVAPGSTTLLKVDAQGFDIEVLRGADDALSHCVAVQIEVSGAPLYEDVPPLHEVIAYLHERSFRITGLFPIVRDPSDRLQVVDFDATFVRVPVRTAGSRATSR